MTLSRHDKFCWDYFCQKKIIKNEMKKKKKISYNNTM